MVFVGGLKAGLIQGRGREAVVCLVGVIEPWGGRFRCLGGALSLNNGFQDRAVGSDRSYRAGATPKGCQS